MSRSRNSRPVLIGLAIALGIFTATCAQKGGRATQSIAESAADAAIAVFSPAPAFAQAGGTGETVTIADVAERVVPSVVNISATRVTKERRLPLTPFFGDPFFRDFFQGPHQGVPKERRQRSLGSGVIVSADGVVLTNNHVVENAEEVEVSLADGRDFEAKVVGTDPKSDVAVLRLQGELKNLQPLDFGDSSQLRLGDVVIAVGNPFGVGQTVTMGIVSAKGRANVGIVDYEDFIQTDAAINPGNSGGALVNMRGELVGVNTAILSRSGGYQGIGFAIPTNLARPVMNSLLEHGKVVRGYLGVTIQDLTGELAKGLELGSDKGVLVSDVGKDTPAEKAGFKRGDVILKMNGTPMESTSKLRNTIAMAGPGKKVRFEVLRDGKTISLQATLQELPDELAGGPSVEPDQGALEGATFGDLDQSARRRFDIADSVKHGVVVESVGPGSRADRAGLEAGDVILELNRKPVKSASSFHKRFESAKGETQLLLVSRGERTLYIAVGK